MTENTLGWVNALRIVSVLTQPIPVIFGLPPVRRFELTAKDSLEIREETPLEGYLEVSIDNREGPTLWVHEWEVGATEVTFNGVVQSLAPAVRNRNPDLRQPGWPLQPPSRRSMLTKGISVGMFVDDTRSESTVIHLEEDGKEATYSGIGRTPVWYSGTGVSNNHPPQLVIESDGLRLMGRHNHIVVDY